MNIVNDLLIGLSGYTIGSLQKDKKTQIIERFQDVINKLEIKNEFAGDTWYLEFEPIKTYLYNEISGIDLYTTIYFGTYYETPQAMVNISDVILGTTVYKTVCISRNTWAKQTIMYESKQFIFETITSNEQVFDGYVDFIV